MGARRTRRFAKELPLHLIMLPGVVFLLLFSYLPIYGVTIAFQRFIPALGLLGHQRWIGLGNFQFMISLPSTRQVFYNTLSISALKIVFGMLVPIVVSLMLNEVRNRGFKRSVQTVVYFPYFISWVVLGSILIDLLSPNTGVVNQIIKGLGLKPIYFLGDNRWFQPTMVASDVWKNFGFNSVIYLAALSTIDPGLYEAAAIDGAGRLRQTLHITLPGLGMIVSLLLVLNLGGILNAGFDQIFNMYSPQVYDSGDIIDTLVYRLGILQTQYGPATAVGLLKGVVSFVLISLSYLTAYRFFGYTLF